MTDQKLKTSFSLDGETKEVIKNTQRIRWGILSTAAIANKIVHSIHGSVNAEVVAVASRGLEKAKKWADERNIPKAYGTYEELLDDPEVDAVYIPLPTGLRTLWAIKAVQKGKHILIEKPAAVSYSELTAITNLCSDHRRQFMDGTQWLHSTRARHLQEETLPHFYRGLPHTDSSSCKYGELRAITTSCSYKAQTDWNQGNNIRGEKDLEPMGLLGDVGWYAIGAIMLAMGYQLPYRVLVTYVRFNQQKVITTCAATLWFRVQNPNQANNNFSGDIHEVVANFDCGGEVARRSTFEFLGEHALVRDGAYHNRTYRESGYYKLGDASGKETIVEVGDCYQSIKMIEEFSSNVLQDTPNPLWAKKSLATQIVLDAVFYSATNGKISVDIKELKGEVEISPSSSSVPTTLRKKRKVSADKKVKRWFYNLGTVAGFLLPIAACVVLARYSSKTSQKKG